MMRSALNMQTSSRRAVSLAFMGGRPTATKTSFASCRRMSDESSSNALEPEDSKTSKIYPVYVHHLSKLILQHLQEKHSSWLVDNGLHTGLRLNANGTFVIRFPPEKGQPASGRIWTSYDSENKQHWLTLSKESLAGKFLLRDNTKAPSSTTTLEATEEQVQAAVDKMVKILNEMEGKM
mmetsp:Transcript_5675/g.7436  ORF Transcript_5675/g.7436 Transcript_5675/m.7436 type:complete len:179 (-) Transcript_5675:62-598(-)|eukprot:CAMPEP_0195296794 /NCGR_PEP_ID=MMETSP0707-20130614/20196_1 /TAXON_ID=33640 /ORGANISM="Asterionellopsis glacialis, Strain CCMP134" /LENGTH=178 /DNA_ID=CAMNT_0040358411 /DNA_START=47 /DNA_END=583 /DNA_ORIENTATION=+